MIFFFYAEYVFDYNYRWLETDSSLKESSKQPNCTHRIPDLRCILTTSLIVARIASAMHFPNKKLILVSLNYQKTRQDCSFPEGFL